MEFPKEARCKNCCHYTEPVQSGSYGQCGLMSGSKGVAMNVSTLAFAEDGDMYSAWVNTYPDFGCVQFEVKK